MSTIIIQKPTPPSLLLSPDGSRDRNGVVVPEVGTTTEITVGQHAYAWDMSVRATTSYIRIPHTVAGVTPAKGMTLIRFRANGTPAGNEYISALGINGSTGRWVAVRVNTLAGQSYICIETRLSTGTTQLSSAIAFPRNQNLTAVLSWEDGVYSLSCNGETVTVSVSSVDAFSNTYWSLNRFNSNLTLNGYVESALAFDIPLTDEEISRITTMDEAWSWNGVSQQVMRPEEVAISPPLRGNRNTHIETVVYETDRDNISRKPLNHVTEVEADWDIDRSGSKSQVSISTHKQVLADGRWIAPHQIITPEVGDVVEQQIGHFRLGTPSAVFDNSVDTFGDDKVMQSAVGSDIADLLAQAGLPFTFVTPADGHVMSDVRYLIKLATMGRVGRNLVLNAGFESAAMTNWSVGLSHAGVGGVAPTTFIVAEGKQSANFLFEPGRSAGQWLRARQEVVIPPDTNLILISGITWQGASYHNPQLKYEWLDETGASLSTELSIDGLQLYQGWMRQFAVVNKPIGAARLNIRLYTYITNTLATASSTRWDDIQVRPVTTVPLPDDRINLPKYPAKATTRIQTTGGASIGFEAINADRLAAIGHHALYTDLTGRLTSSPSRELGSATVMRTYREGDYRFVGVMEVERSASNRFNTVTAVKESFQEGVVPMVVTVWNDEQTDPWSVHQLGNVSYPNGPLMVQDAVDEAALESAAMAMLGRATMQHVLRIEVLPDPTLTVHGVIEIIGGPEDVQGRWLIEYLRPGLSAKNPTVQIGARRSLSSVGVTHG